MFDSTAAFGVVVSCESCLLEIKFGIRGTALKLVSPYLTCMEEVNRCLSVMLQQYGVPQGSVFDPVLFLLYTRTSAYRVLSHCHAYYILLSRISNSLITVNRRRHYKKVVTFLAYKDA